MFSWKSFLPVRLKIAGANFNVLIDELQKQNIKFRTQRSNDTELILETTENNLPLLFDLLKRKCYNYTISYKSGINLSKICGVLAGLILCLIIYVVLSNFCLGVQINTENVELAEKIETVLSRSIANTRPRDFYDIHILYSLRGAECNPETLLQALERTANKRGSQKVLRQYQDIISEIRSSEQLRGFWKKYQRDFDYAKDISFDDACDTIQHIMNSMLQNK